MAVRIDLRLAWKRGLTGWGSSTRNRNSTNLEVFKVIEIRESRLSSDPIAMCELLVGLPRFGSNPLRHEGSPGALSQKKTQRMG